MIFVSFYTKNTGYEKEVKNLIASLEHLKLKYDIQGIESKGDWFKNIKFKPSFIYNMLKKHSVEDKVIWIDADAVVRQYPKLFETISEDIAVHYSNNHWHPDPEMLSGTMMFRNNKKVHSMFERWINCCERDEKQTEQRILQWLIEHRYVDVSVYDLPSSYVKIFDLNETGEYNVDPVIEHFQASRRYKKDV